MTRLIKYVKKMPSPKISVSYSQMFIKIFSQKMHEHRPGIRDAKSEVEKCVIFFYFVYIFTNVICRNLNSLFFVSIQWFNVAQLKQAHSET
jgi:hypothetical protein